MAALSGGGQRGTGVCGARVRGCAARSGALTTRAGRRGGGVLQLLALLHVGACGVADGAANSLAILPLTAATSLDADGGTAPHDPATTDPDGADTMAEHNSTHSHCTMLDVTPDARDDSADDVPTTLRGGRSRDLLLPCLLYTSPSPPD
jgi:hypothetical protein